ncbi:MAG: glycosyltransferase family 39 protein [Thermodesulfobacteriota bacterium]
MERTFSPCRILFLIVFFAFIVRLFVAVNTEVVSADSVEYIRLAKAFASGDYMGALDVRRPPLYPVLIGLASFVAPDFELAGRLVSLVFGVLTVAMVYLLSRRVFNEKTALIASAFAAVHPYMLRYSGDVLTETLYYFLVASVAFLGLKAVIEKSLLFMFLAGIAGAFAYMTKPAGLIALMAITLFAAFERPGRIIAERRQRLILLFSLWAIFIIMALPYLIFIYRATGAVEITGKLSSTDFLSLAFGGFMEEGNALMFVRHFPEAWSYPFFALFLLYIFKRRKAGFEREEKFLLFLAAFYWLVCLLVLPRRRYLVHMMPLVLVFSAQGAIYFIEWLKAIFKERLRSVVTALAVVLAAAEILIGTASLTHQRVAEKAAGLYIKESIGPGIAILSRKPIVVFYAEGKHVPMPRDKLFTLKEFFDYGRENSVAYLADYRTGVRDSIVDFKDDAFEEVKSFNDGDGKEFVIYRLPYEALR